jgi:hypothetical protein
MFGALLVLGVGAAAARFVMGHGVGFTGVLTLSPGRRMAPIFVMVGSVANHATVTGPAIDTAAQTAIAGALAERVEITTAPPAPGTARSARGRSQGHVLDANIQSVTVTGTHTRVEVSIVVSSHPSRVYEFESTSSVTLAGTGSTSDTVAMGVRRAMRSATLQAVDRIVRTRM